MATIGKNNPPTKEDVDSFVKMIDFTLQIRFIDFFEGANGAEINADEGFVILWPLTDMIQLNKEYSVEEYAPEFFIFCSDGGDMAYGIERLTGFIFEMPFIGMSKEAAVLRNETFTRFIEDLK